MGEGLLEGGRAWSAWVFREGLTTCFAPRISVPVHSFASLSIKTTGEFPTPGFQSVCPLVHFCPNHTLAMALF